MSRTPAAQLARLKVTYPAWIIQRAGTGFTAQRRGSLDGHISVRTLAALETALAAAEPEKPAWQ